MLFSWPAFFSCWPGRHGPAGQGGISDNLDNLVFFPARAPGQSRRMSDAQFLKGAMPNAAQVDAFVGAYGPAWSIWMDQRRGRPSLIDGGAIPFIPRPRELVGLGDLLPLLPRECVPASGTGRKGSSCLPGAVARSARRRSQRAGPRSGGLATHWELDLTSYVSGGPPAAFPWRAPRSTSASTGETSSRWPPQDRGPQTRPGADRSASRPLGKT